MTQDAEGMQTMRTMADNMAWLLKKIHANDHPDYPKREEWQGMNFIRWKNWEFLITKLQFNGHVF